MSTRGDINGNQRKCWYCLRTIIIFNIRLVRNGKILFVITIAIPCISWCGGGARGLTSSAVAYWVEMRIKTRSDYKQEDCRLIYSSYLSTGTYLRYQLIFSSSLQTNAIERNHMVCCHIIDSTTNSNITKTHLVPIICVAISN